MRALSDADYRNLALFRRALRQFLRFSEDHARSAGLTPSQHQLLLAIRGAPSPPPTIGDVAEALQLRHHSTVELVDRAQAAGLIERVADERDARRQLLRLTAKGEEVLDGLTRVHRDELRRFRTEMLDVLKELET
ncbi:MAG: MarR family transcriptional regulator [Acidimicrobiales bacterium]|nr:MarR family transcriptional regulator [Acidimicrobiales bacterium]